MMTPGKLYRINPKGLYREKLEANNIHFFLIIARTDNSVTLLHDNGEVKTVTIQKELSWRKQFLEVFTEDWTLLGDYSKPW